MRQNIFYRHRCRKSANNSFIPFVKLYFYHSLVRFTRIILAVDLFSHDTFEILSLLPPGKSSRLLPTPDRNFNDLTLFNNVLE